MQKLMESGAYTRLGFWRDRRGENEIDIIAADELSQTVSYYEVKRQKYRANLEILRAKAAAFRQATKEFKGFQEEFEALGMEEM